MSDIVAKLRAGAALEEKYDESGIRYIGLGKSLKHEAADEIEKLRAQIEELRSLVQQGVELADFLTEIRRY